MPKGFSGYNQRNGATLSERLASRSDRSGGPDACWIWKGGVSRGYGSIHYGGKTCRAHRAAWEQANGSVQTGLFVLHRCDNPLCVNPDHLFLGTQAANMADMARKGRDQGKLTPDQVRRVRSDRRTQAEIARDFCVDQTTISRIKRGASRTHI
jgi:hypothetical protein